MEAACPACKQIFTPIGGGREPLVISCGDSICNECIVQMSLSYSFPPTSSSLKPVDDFIKDYCSNTASLVRKDSDHTHAHLQDDRLQFRYIAAQGSGFDDVTSPMVTTQLDVSTCRDRNMTVASQLCNS